MRKKPLDSGFKEIFSGYTKLLPILSHELGRNAAFFCSLTGPLYVSVVRYYCKTYDVRPLEVTETFIKLDFHLIKSQKSGLLYEINSFIDISYLLILVTRPLCEMRQSFLILSGKVHNSELILSVLKGNSFSKSTFVRSGWCTYNFVIFNEKFSLIHFYQKISGEA